MKQRKTFFIRRATAIRLLVLLFILAGHVGLSAPTLVPPKTRTDNVREIVHGREITDPYRWLEDDKSPETAAWIRSQNDYTRSILGPLAGEEKLNRQLKALVTPEHVGPPMLRNGIYFFTKKRPEQEQSAIYMRKSFKGKDLLLVDPAQISADHSKSVSLWSVSQDGSRLAYAVRQGGEDEIMLHFLDTATRQNLPDQLPRGRYFSVSWNIDNSGFYYTVHRADGPRLYHHTMGQNVSTDEVIFGKEYGADRFINATLSEDGKYLLITVTHGLVESEIYYQDVSAHGTIQPLVNDIKARFIGRAAGDHLYLFTNWQAPRGRIFDVDLKNPGRDRWQEIIPPSESVIESFSLVGGRICIRYLQNLAYTVKLFDTKGKYLSDIAFPAIGTVAETGGQWKSNEAFFTFSSFHIPPTHYRYRMDRRKLDVWSRLKVPIDSKKFEVKQLWYPSKDGTKIPLFVVHAKGLKLNGTNPALLTGYGGFMVSMKPSFSPQTALWVQQGGVYALANLRGGGEFGEEWHKDGMLEKKQNVFNDFIAAAEYLIRNGYTNPSKLAISGRSNGGLLVGAALTQRPDLFQAVLCGYPLLDMVRYHRFLIASTWVPEYGSSEDPAQFNFLYAYSPYHRVQPGAKYPAVLFVTGDSDTRVDPLHARKMAALLQASTGSDRPVLLLYEKSAGHSAGQPTSKVIEEAAYQLSFLFWQLGV